MYLFFLHLFFSAPCALSFSLSLLNDTLRTIAYPSRLVVLPVPVLLGVSAPQGGRVLRLFGVNELVVVRRLQRSGLARRTALVVDTSNASFASDGRRSDRGAVLRGTRAV